MPPERRDRRRQPDRRAPHRPPRAPSGFFESLGGSLIQSRATYPELVERVAFEDDIRTFRISTNTLGNGFVECIANSTLLAIRDRQPAAMRGTALMVPVLEASGSARIGRFGWKSQHASLESFAADAYLNEMGITSPLFPEENTSSGRFVGYGSGVRPRARSRGRRRGRRSPSPTSCAPPRRRRAARSPPTSQAGDALFANVGCAMCHVPSITTARAGTAINGGAFIVPAGARQQDHPSLQRLPVARHRHRRRHPVPAARRSTRRPRARSAPRRCGRCARATA